MLPGDCAEEMILTSPLDVANKVAACHVWHVGAKTGKVTLEWMATTEENKTKQVRHAQQQ